MACRGYREALANVAAGGPPSASVEAHLASCERCRTRLARLRQALSAADAEMAGLVAAEPSPGLATRIRQAVAIAKPSPPWPFGWLWPAAAATATVTVALAVWAGRPVTPSGIGLSAGLSSRGAPGVSRAEGAAVPPTRTAAAPRTTVAPRSAGPVQRPEARRASASLRTRQVGVPRDDRLEVLVPPGEAEALLQFAAHLQDRSVAPDSLLVADLSAPLPEPKAIEIQSLEIVPLDPAETPGMD
jgi:anti-sigma factor RsiW